MELGRYEPSMLTEAAKAHYEKYWHLARELFISGDYPLAAFFAITLIEEVGKTVALAAAVRGNAEARKAFRVIKASTSMLSGLLSL